MDWVALAKQIDAGTARAFVEASRHVIDALLIEAERVEQARTPTVRDYNTRGLSRAAPAGGWISTSELRQATREMNEALATERWVDGFLAAVRVLGRIGG